MQVLLLQDMGVVHVDVDVMMVMTAVLLLLTKSGNAIWSNTSCDTSRRCFSRRSRLTRDALFGSLTGRPGCVLKYTRGESISEGVRG